MTAALGSLLVEPVPRLVGHVAVPGDKSISHRSVLIGAMCDGETHVTGFGRSADTEATIAAVRALGVDVYEHGVDTLRVFGKGLRGLRAPGRPIDCANAGTLVRLIAGILAGQDGESFELTGDESLSRRPMGRISEPLGRMGARLETTDGHLPMTVSGDALHAIDYALPVASAQVKSAILLAGLFADGETTVVEPAPTRDHTERMLQAAGADVAVRSTSVTVRPAERLSLGEVEVPGDFSSAAPFIVAATLVQGSELHVHGVNLNPRRTGLLEILERMGANVTVYNRRSIGGEPGGDLEIHSAPLVGTAVAQRTCRSRSTSCRSSRSRRRARAARACCAARRSSARRRRTGSRRPSTRCGRSARAPVRTRTASRSRAYPHGSAAGGSTAAATTASPCSARSPVSPRGKACASRARTSWG